MDEATRLAMIVAAKLRVTERLEPRQAEYRAWLAKWITKRDARYNLVVPLLKGTEPLRHPKGMKSKAHSRKHLWADAVWCGDVTTSDCPEEFFGEAWTEWTRPFDDEMKSMFYEAAQEWLNEQFDFAFRKVMPRSLHEVLEG
jgi:hypothetical protein